MKIQKPTTKDFEKWIPNIKVWINGSGDCYLDKKYKCTYIEIVSNQKKFGHCSECEYFMGHRKNENNIYSMTDLPACCWHRLNLTSK